jgi:hypothetical protein
MVPPVIIDGLTDKIAPVLAVVPTDRPSDPLLKGLRVSKQGEIIPLCILPLVQWGSMCISLTGEKFTR